MCRSILVQARTDASFVRETGDGRLMRVPAYFATPPVVVNDGQGYDIDALQANLDHKVEQWNKRGSNFNTERVSRFVLLIHPYRPLHGSTFVRTPDFLEKKHCLVNVQNDDEKCFVWSVLSALYPGAHNPQRLSNYINREPSLNLEGLTFPVQTKQIPLFEKLNPSDSINVLTFEESSKGFTVEYRSPKREREHHVNLLLLEDADNPSKRHYVWIKICPHSFVTEPIRIIPHSFAIHVSTSFLPNNISTITYPTVFNTSLNMLSIPIPKTKRSAC